MDRLPPSSFIRPSLSAAAQRPTARVWLSGWCQRARLLLACAQHVFSAHEMEWTHPGCQPRLLVVAVAIGVAPVLCRQEVIITVTLCSCHVNLVPVRRFPTMAYLGPRQLF